jgi:hypothetical protein
MILRVVDARRSLEHNEVYTITFDIVASHEVKVKAGEERRDDNRLERKLNMLKPRF